MLLLPQSPSLLIVSPHRLLNLRLLFWEEFNSLRGTQDSRGTPPWALPPVVILISTLPPTSVLRVLLFVDPELVSPSVCSALLLEIEAAQIQQTPEACMRHVVSHTLQAALGEACRAEALQRKLKVMALPQPSGLQSRAPRAHARCLLCSSSPFSCAM